MEIIHVNGKKIKYILLYALSTCVWCKKTKSYLNELGVEYDYIDVDLLSEKEKDKIKKSIKKWNPAVSFPTIVIDNKTVVLGYDEEKIKESLGL